MAAIRDLKPDVNNLFLDGKFESVSLFQGEMDISVLRDEGTTVEYAQRCIAHYNELARNERILADIQLRLARFMLYMYEEWKAMGIYDDIAKGIEPAIRDYESGKSLLAHLTKPRMYVEGPSEGDEVGYVIEAECPWEPEHMCSIVVRESEVEYVGPSEGNTPWDDDEDFYCIWEDED